MVTEHHAEAVNTRPSTQKSVSIYTRQDAFMKHPLHDAETIQNGWGGMHSWFGGPLRGPKNGKSIVLLAWE